MILESTKHEGPFFKVAAEQMKQKTMPEWKEHVIEGQLSVDVFDTGDALTILAPIAGAIGDRIEVYIHNDLVTVRGQRPFPVSESGELKPLHQECYWGTFSRTIVLPVEVRGEQAEAMYRSGVLILTIPKTRGDARVPITVVEE